MEDRRIKLRRHIQAARAWLLQADRSLERENDVQGDLKLMLARAELAQTKSSHRSWAKRMLPALTALLIAGAVLFGDVPAESDETAAVATIETIDTIETSKESELSRLEQPSIEQPDTIVETPIETNDAPIETYVEAPIETPITEPAFNDYEEYATEPYVELAVESYEPEYYAPEPAFEEPNYVPAAAVPTEDIQQLMLDAGQILRAK